MDKAKSILELLLAPDTFSPDIPSAERFLLRMIAPGSAFIGVPLALLMLAGSPYPALGTTLLAIVGVAISIGPRYAPIGAFIAGNVFTVAITANPDTVPSLMPAFLLLLLTAIEFGRAHGITLAVALTLTTTVLIFGWLNIFWYGDSVTLAIWFLVFAALIAVDGWLLWDKSRQRRAQFSEALAEVRQNVEVERGQRRFLEERGRIAREMHDVVAHHMSMVAVKASTAEYRLEDLSDETREEFRAIAATARESLTEMRKILAVFRTDEERELAPQPGIERIDDLCQSARDAGLQVTATVSDDLPQPPDAVSLTGYRIVQEALSNVVRHAPGAAATVELYPEADWLAIVVMNGAATRTHVRENKTDETDETDDVPTTPERIATPEMAGAGGLGLAGMRERVELLNGELFAQPLGGSGFLVKARLPMELMEDG